jgi:transcriptional regulator with XRE-family HTH domain
VPTPSKHSRDPVLLALGGAIRARRLKAKLSQEGLADLADLDRSYVGQVERGENSAAIHALIRIAKALNTTAAELFVDAEL